MVVLKKKQKEGQKKIISQKDIRKKMNPPSFFSIFNKVLPYTPVYTTQQIIHLSTHHTQLQMILSHASNQNQNPIFKSNK